LRKSLRYKKRNSAGTVPVNDRTLWFSDLSSLDPNKKNEVWAAQALFFMKRNATIFLDPKKAKKYRNADQLKIDNVREFKDVLLKSNGAILCAEVPAVTGGNIFIMSE
jgi:hypothetical protein